MSISQFVSILRARWLLAASVAVSAVLITWVVCFFMPKKYTAVATVVVDVKTPDPIAGINNPALMMPSYMGTQLDILTSNQVAQRAARALNMHNNMQWRESWMADTDGRGDFESWLGDWLQRNLDVKPPRESNVLAITYTSPDARFAARVANAVAKAYIDTNMDLRVEPAKQYSGFFDERVKRARAQLEQAQSKLSDYQKDKGIVSADERLDVETARMNELSTQMVMLRTLSAESNSRLTQSHTQADQLQDVLQSGLIGNLKTEIARTEARLQELTARLGDAHPDVAQTKASLVSLKSKLESEIRRISGGVQTSNSINQAREAEVRAAYEAQRQKVLKLKAQRDEMSVLEKDVESAQRAFDAIQGRLNQTNLESQNMQTNLAVLNPATEPVEPSSPKTLRNLALSVFGGTLGGLIVALLREAFDRRIRSGEDVLNDFELPVLGVIPHPNNKTWFGQRRGKATWLQPHLLPRLPSPAGKPGHG